MNHLFTHATAMRDALEIPDAHCPVCCRLTLHRVGWVCAECDRCKATWGDEEWRGSIARKRREVLRLDRTQMAVLLGVERKAVVYAETRRCSDAYWQATEQAVLNHSLKND